MNSFCNTVFVIVMQIKLVVVVVVVVPAACITANLFSFVYPTQTKYIGTIEGKLNLSNDLTLIKLIKTRLGSNTTQSTATTELDVFPRG